LPFCGAASSSSSANNDDAPAWAASSPVSTTLSVGG
jgi:hypothetical protein